MEETNKLTRKNKIILIVGIVLFLILILSASYAYFAITSVNNAITTTITGNGEALGTPTLTTNTTSLGLNLTSTLMSTDNSSKRIYATTDGSGILEDARYPSPGFTTPVTMGNGRYVLATASVAGGDISYNCAYNFDVNATVTNAIADGSDQDVYLLINSPSGETYRYRLDQLLEGTKTISGTIKNLSKGENQEFTIENYVYNYGVHNQEGLIGNEYSIYVTPKSGAQGFSCTAVPSVTSTGFAKTLIDSGTLWNSEFDGDGYRFIGTNTDSQVCSYENGSGYSAVVNNACSTFYNIITTRKSDGLLIEEINFAGDPADWVVENDTEYNYEVTTLTGTKTTKKVNNYICFGTTNKSDCTSNPDKYMYRIVGVFPDENSVYHVKLIKDKTIGTYAYHGNATKSVDWKDTDLYKGLNGAYFYTNTTYDYMQNSTWRNKITDWRWTSSMDKKLNRGNSNDLNFEGKMDYSSYDIKNVYLHEMNKRSKKYTTGYWSYITSKIGLLNISDYRLSLGLALDGDNSNVGYLSWLNNQTTTTSTYFWTLAERSTTTSAFAGITYRLSSSNSATVGSTATSKRNVQPVFYLNSDIDISGGTGTNTDPYILK